LRDYTFCDPNSKPILVCYNLSQMFGFGDKKIIFATHSNRFHTDDVFATAVLMLFLKDKEIEIVRTRDEEIIKSADYVYDVGGIYDESLNRFDHHQEGGAGTRKNGIPYSSFGLVWKKFGKELCGSQEVADFLDKKIVQFVDAMDNGIKTFKEDDDETKTYLFIDAVDAFNPFWPEEEKFDERFLEIVEFAKRILQREIERAKNLEDAKSILKKIYDETDDKRIIYLDKNYPWENILNKYPEPVFVVKSRGEGMCSVNSVRDNIYSFETRKLFPESWAGKSGKGLADITGVEDAIFCHNKLFICSAKSKDGAVRLAQLALEE